MCLLARLRITSAPDFPTCLPGLAVPMDGDGRGEQERVWETPRYLTYGSHKQTTQRRREGSMEALVSGKLQ